MLFLIASLFFACEEEVACTAEFVYSSQIDIIDEEGEPVTAASISYHVDGVEGEYVENYETGTYVVGGEEAGDFVVHISVEIPFEDDVCCWDIGEKTLEYTVEKNVCHVIPVSMETELDWSIRCMDTEECEELKRTGLAYVFLNLLVKEDSLCPNKL